jgi:PIN domain nuclease of toxin-antitoxin system
MNQYVADTHALFWYLTSAPNLGATAKAVFQDGAQGKASIFLPAIVLAELFYLNKKLGEPIDFAANFRLLSASSQFIFVPFEATDTLDFDRNAATPEMHDRMIVGTALRIGAPCLTCDSQIIKSGLVKIVW